NSLSRLFTYFYKFDDKLLLFKHRRMPFPSLALGVESQNLVSDCRGNPFCEERAKRLQRKARPSSGERPNYEKTH
ncbi:hypothetical protein ACVWYG_002986, partial [Pedobacter sp. UYEF25]